MLEVICPKCETLLGIDEKLNGRRVGCPHCGATFRIDEPAEERVPPSPPPRPALVRKPRPAPPLDDDIEEVEVVVERSGKRRPNSKDADEQADRGLNSVFDEVGKKRKKKKRPTKRRITTDSSDTSRGDSEGSWLVGGFLIFLGGCQILGAILNLVSPQPGPKLLVPNLGFLSGPSFIMFGLTKIPR